MNLRFNKKLLATLLLVGNIASITEPVYAKEVNIASETEDINDYVVANDDIKIYEEISGSVIATLEKGHSLKFLTEIEGNYEVLYNNDTAYVKKDNAKIVHLDDPQKAIYVKNETTVYDSVLMNNELANIGKLEYCDVYDETEDSYLVMADSIIGYISKLNTVDLEGKYIILDLSEQNVKMYVDSKLILDSPAVTGRGENSRTHVGVFKIFRIRHNCYLIGPTWCNYVDYMLNFDGGVGFHDAEYHTHEDGKTHGWRDKSEFGGETYKTNGSHGCCNLPNESAKTIYENAEIGTLVIVKR